MAFSYKVNHALNQDLPIDLKYLSQGNVIDLKYLPQRNVNLILHKNLYINVHGSFIHSIIKY